MPREAFEQMNNYWKEIEGAAYGSAKVTHQWFFKMASGSRKYHPVRVEFVYPDGSNGMRYMEARDDYVIVSI